MVDWGALAIIGPDKAPPHIPSSPQPTKYSVSDFTSWHQTHHHVLQRLERLFFFISGLCNEDSPGLYKFSLQAQEAEIDTHEAE